MAVSAPQARDALPPHNIEAEASVLGSILITEHALDLILVDADAKLAPEDFYRSRHELIFRSMLRLKEKPTPEPVDALTVCDELKRAGQLEEAGGEAYVHALPTPVPTAHHARHYARIVKEHALMRRLLDTARKIQEDVLSFSGDPSDLVEQAEAALFKVAHAEHTGDVRGIDDILHQELDRLEEISRDGLEVRGTPSGFKDLDRRTGGFQPGNLIVVAARPSMGKSALVTNIAENAAVKYGKATVLFSLEMSENELAQRFIASQANLSSDELRKGQVKEERWPRIIRATEKLAGSPLFVDDSSDLGIHELRAKARRLAGRHPLGLVIVDYLQLMRPEDSSQNRVEQIGQISRGLKILARELEVPVIAVSQLSRAVEQRPDKRPILSDLRESGQIEQDADLVIFIYRDDRYNDDSDRQGEADLIVAKHRNGPVGIETIVFLERFPKFADRAREHEAAAAAPSNGAG
ncbi:MAG: replicative DNA helicase [Thermoleophilaceae bacterium]|nr:replicative DNA helicase [Thermoleophilaceae bacterium]